MTTKNVSLARAALLLQPEIEVCPSREPGHRNHEVAPAIAHQSLDAAFVVALAGPAIPIPDQVMRQEAAEQLGPDPRPIGLNARHQAFVIVVEDRGRHAAKERKGMHMAINPSLGRGCLKRPNITGVAVRQVEGEEMGLLFNAADHHHGLTEIGLSMAGRMAQRHEHLPPTPLLFAHVILDDRIAAGEAVLISQPLKDPLGRMPLLAVPSLILAQPLVDDGGKSVQLRPLDRRRSAVARRHGKAQHLLHAVTRDPEMLRRRSRAHALRTGKPHLPIEFHGENPPALPVTRKGKGGRLLRRPQQASPAATVADYCSAAYNCSD